MRPLQKQILALASVTGTLLLVHLSLQTLALLRASDPPSPLYIERLAVLLVYFIVPLVAGWVSFRYWLLVPAGLGAVFIASLAFVVTHQPSFLFFHLLFTGIYLVLDWQRRQKQDEILLNEVEIEKLENEKNQLGLKIKKMKEEMDASVAKYTTYYGLREVGEKLAMSLILGDVSEMVVKEARNFFPKGESFLLYLAETREMGLSLAASSSQHDDEKIKAKRGGMYDLWVLKNRKHLLISDTQKDIFFDQSRADESDQIRSVMVVPLIIEARVVGVFRVNSSQPEAFSLDDLRLLDFLSDIASPAISNAALYQKTEELAIRDSLTGIYVQRYFKERLKEEHKRALITSAKLSVLMCDLDHFKSYNDSFGHGAGDLILTSVSAILNSEVGDNGIVARYGGEEFSVLLPRFSKEAAVELAERIRKKVSEATIDIRREATRTTVSIGVSTMPDDTLERDELLRRADQRLYEAKRKGRNRVC